MESIRYLHNVMLGILIEFSKVCKNNDLKFWLEGGTLLGAVRHHGFIPWDDDLDVCMPRDDYNKLLILGNKVMNEPFFLQTTETDNEYYCAFARLQNTNTTYITKNIINSKCRKGIYIDIIPYDGLISRGVFGSIQSNYIRFVNVCCNAYAYNANKSIITRFINKILKVTGCNLQRRTKKINAVAEKRSFNDSEYVGPLTCCEYSFRQMILKKEWFNKTVLLDFEGSMMPVPAGYKEILSAIYGDYMSFPLEGDRVPKHQAIFDTKTSYVEFNLKGNKD